MKITREDLREWHLKDLTVRVRGRLYRVGKMSYGDYFLEPRDWKGGEKDGFSPDTDWFYLVDAQKGIYGLESNRGRVSLGTK